MERRRVTRKPVSTLILSCALEDDSPGMLFFPVTNFSPTGARLATALVLAEGTEFFAEVPWDDHESRSPVKVQCRVIHSRKLIGATTMGIQFINTDVNTKAMLTELYNGLADTLEKKRPSLNKKEDE